MQKPTQRPKNSRADVLQTGIGMKKMWINRSGN